MKKNLLTSAQKKSNINSLIKDLFSIDILCVKSTFDTSEFIPIQGRWLGG